MSDVLSILSIDALKTSEYIAVADLLLYLITPIKQHRKEWINKLKIKDEIEILNLNLKTSYIIILLI